MAKRFPNDPVDKVMKVMMGDYGQDTDHPWHRLERGEISMVEYREQLGPLVLEAGLQLSANSLETPAAKTADSKNPSIVGFAFEPNHLVVNLVHELKSCGFRLGVLTNNVRELRQAWWPMLDFANIFDDVEGPIGREAKLLADIAFRANKTSNGGLLGLFSLCDIGFCYAKLFCIEHGVINPFNKV